jgi:protein-S-isoprenylcysteine O-methyltransferase Ste14
VQASTARSLALVMGVVHGVVWVLGTRWERAGRTAQLRTSLHRPPLPARAGYGALVIPLVYPLVVALAPRLGYEGASNWASAIDEVLLAIGIGLWAAGVSLLVWAARNLGGYLDVDGVTEDHELVSSGPYRYVRHPVYASFTAIALGLGFVFRSYLLVGVAVAWFATARWSAAAEEALLASPAGLDDDYRTYQERTGRFLPRLRRDQR